MLATKELGAKWLVDMATYISNSPQIIVNGFIRSGITAAVDGQDIEDTEDQDLEDRILRMTLMSLKRALVTVSSNLVFCLTIIILTI